MVATKTELLLMSPPAQYLKTEQVAAAAAAAAAAHPKPATEEDAGHAHAAACPVIDLSPLFQPESTKKRPAIVEAIAAAAESWGFFQVLNHGLSPELMKKVFSVSKEFFGLPLPEKLKARPEAGASPVATGFVHDDHTKGELDQKEHLLFFTEGAAPGGGKLEIVNPYSHYNVWPQKPTNLRPVVNEVIKEAEKTAIFIMGLVSESLGLPTNFIHEHYSEKTNAFTLFFYPTAPQEEVVGNPAHKDGNVLTLLAQDEVSGLQVLKDDQWVTITPIKGAFIVNVGDILQVWSNDKYKSVKHRVVNNKEQDRYSFAFFCTPGLQTTVNPLAHFTSTIYEAPKYHTFVYKEYMMHRFNNKKNMNPHVEDIGIDIYAF